MDDKGQHSPSSSHVTKRFEDSAGVVFNVIDDTLSSHIVQYFTYSGRVSMYFKKDSSTASTTKVFLDFHHNWKSTSISGSASFNNVGLTGAGYSLNITYTTKNNSWQRGSGGQTATAR